MRKTGGENLRMASKEAWLDQPECPRAWEVEGFKTSYCVLLSFGPVDQTWGRSSCRMDVDCLST